MADVFVVQVEGVGRKGQLASAFSKRQREVQNRINRTMRTLEKVLPMTFKSLAPRDTEELVDSIEGVAFFRANAVRVSVRARAVRDGFDYLPVTRYGHRVAEIRNKTKRAMTVYPKGRHGRRVLRTKVRGYRPASDWVDVATRASDPFIDHEVQRLGRDIERIRVQ